jgi:hypothetical protein
MESILETKAATILEFIQGLRGSLSVTFEEGTSAAWLHDLLKPHVTRPRGLRSAQEPVRQQARHDLLTESRKHHAVKLLRQIPSIGPIRAALLVAQLQTPPVSVPSASSGLTVVSRWRPTTAASTAMSEGNCNETGSA